MTDIQMIALEIMISKKWFKDNEDTLTDNIINATVDAKKFFELSQMVEIGEYDE